jgi:predicted small lipoprotein YifL
VRRLAALLALLALLSSCGTKGPLYLPAPDDRPKPNDNSRR